ncbi:BatA and WFA domain-containing protein [Paenibacillus sp. MY03]|uniref:vWA domain-containing protein n=1 Tax=Paenibacillus sp. MY03 TaxID=302980 RepID=UPI0015C5DFC2|nr:BatA and WFA domain-containing protein [Paenibacillus sp. MY03]
MQFLSAASAWFAVALPIIALMYILKKKYTDTVVPSHMLWNRLLREQEANRPWQKLRSRWLLLLQLLAALIAVLALMQPVRWGAASPDGHAVLFIDRSGSMSASRGDEGPESLTRLEHGLRQAEAWLAEQPSGRPISLVVSGAEPEVLASRESDHRRLAEILDGIVPFYGRSDNSAALSFADSLHGGEGGQTIVLTDGEWIDAKEASELLLNAQTERWHAGPSEAADSPFENGSILSFGLRESGSSPGHQIATVTVRNDSEHSRIYNVTIRAFVLDEGEVYRTGVDMETDALSWQSEETDVLPPADYYTAELRGEPDFITADNMAFQFPQGTQTGKALLVTSGNMFLEKALALAGVQIVKSSPDQPPPTGEIARDLDWVLVDGQLEQLKESAGWAEWLGGMPVWNMDHPVADGTGTVVPTSTEAKALEHPVTAYITLQDTHIGRLYEVGGQDAAWGNPVLTYGGYPAIIAGTEQGRPRLRFTFNLQDTDLPLRPEFPILIVQAAEWMNGSSLPQLGSGLAGSSMSVALQAETETARWAKLDGPALISREQETGSFTMEVERNDSQIRVPDVPGLYRLEERDATGQLIASRLLAVSPDMEELKAVRSSSSGEQLAFHSVQQDDEDNQTVNAGQKQNNGMQQSLIHWAAVLLLGLIMLEWEVYRRGHIG